MDPAATAATASGLSITEAFTTAATFILPHIALLYGFAAFPAVEHSIAGILPGIEHSGQTALTLDF